MQKLQLCAAALALVACATDSSDPSTEPRRGKGHGGSTTTPDAPAPTTPPSTDPTGTVSCYSEGAPSTTCSLPSHCCFGNYTAQHNGYCTTDACAWGTLTCDGPEDCASGQNCCGHKTEYGWMLACSDSACGAPDVNEELCHDSSTCDGQSCVNVYNVNYDLPRTLYVCR